MGFWALGDSGVALAGKDGASAGSMRISADAT